MSCSLQRNLDEPDSSDYGSDFTPDEEGLVNELLAKADAENARLASPAHVSSSTPRAPVAQAEYEDLDSLQPATLAALVADIEDGIHDPPALRLPKVLGREKPRSPWRQTSQRSWLEGASVGRRRGWASSQGSRNDAPSIGTRFRRSL